MPNKIGFFVIAVCRNAEQWIARCIESVEQQSYTDWTMCIVDDASSDNTYNCAIARAGKDKRIRVVRNKERLFSLHNMVRAIDRYSPHNSIIAILDGDDWLSDQKVLSAVAKEYEQNPLLEALWTQYKYTSSGKEGHCRPLPAGKLWEHPWRSSHLKTFRKPLIWGVNRDVWLDEKGEWWKCASDRTLYLPILCLAKEKKFLNRVCYVYNSNAAKDHLEDTQKQTAAAFKKRLAQDEANRKAKSVLFFINGPSAGDKRFVWKPGIARQPMGALVLMARLRARGHKVVLCDRYLNPKWWPSTNTMSGTDIFGVYASTPNANDAHYILSHIREESKVRVLVGGPHTAFAPARLLAQSEVVCRGEADNIILELVEGTHTGIIDAGRVKELDTVPFPAYDYLIEHPLPYRTYWPFGPTKPIACLSSSRGCPHNCAFCDTKAISGREWYGQSPERMVNDVVELVRVTGVNGVYFREDNFGCNRKRLLAFCREMKSANIPADWACELRADIGADEAVVEEMASAGCKGLYVGFESGSQKMLDLFRKGTTVRQNIKTGKNARKFGIGIAASFVVWHPKETPQDRASTKVLIDSLKARTVWCNPYRPPSSCMDK